MVLYIRVNRLIKNYFKRGEYIFILRGGINEKIKNINSVNINIIQVYI